MPQTPDDLIFACWITNVKIRGIRLRHEQKEILEHHIQVAGSTFSLKVHVYTLKSGRSVLSTNWSGASTNSFLPSVHTLGPQKRVIFRNLKLGRYGHMLGGVVNMHETQIYIKIH